MKMRQSGGLVGARGRKAVTKFDEFFGISGIASGKARSKQNVCAIDVPNANLK